MTMTRKLDRRGFLRTGAAASAMTLGLPGIVRAQDYPSGNINVVIPTREGGGADRNFRASPASGRKSWAPISNRASFPAHRAASVTRSTWARTNPMHTT
ncbi:hypothetical protein [Thalassococcus profundi]|uniref:hypothetical protein n=1 Tax=Thalassococcus profundi TaxID=2282382 RepID=UPI0040595C85